MRKEIAFKPNPFLSVVMVTYNHEKYIAQAIESVLMQDTSFGFHLLIGDDKSTDNTLQICQTYESKYPDKITLIKRDKNIGMINNIKNTFENAFKSGVKYIAVLEGDDYWTDEHKLQKQVDFLENNKDFSLCITNAKIFSEKKGTLTEFFHKDFRDVPNHESSLEDLLYINFVPNLTSVFRNKISLPKWFEKVYPGDWQMHLLSAKKGKIGFINEYTAVYRHHDKAVSSANSPIDNCQKYISSTKIIFWNFDIKAKIVLLKTLSRLYSELALLFRYNGNYRKYNYYLRVSKFYNFLNRNV